MGRVLGQGGDAEMLIKSGHLKKCVAVRRSQAGSKASSKIEVTLAWIHIVATWVKRASLGSRWRRASRTSSRAALSTLLLLLIHQGLIPQSHVVLVSAVYSSVSFIGKIKQGSML